MGKQSDSEKKVQFTIGKYERSKDFYRHLRSKFQYWDDLFLSLPKPKAKDHMSNLFIPATHKATMTLLARVVNNTFSVDPNFDVVPSNKEITNLIRSQMYQGGFFNEWVMFCLQLLVRGTSIAKVTWSKKKKKRFTLEKIVENVLKGEGENQTLETIIRGFEKKPVDTLKYDGPVFETIDLLDYYPEPQAIKIDDGTRIFRSVVPKHQFMKGNYVNKKQVLNTQFPGNDDENDSRLRQFGIQPTVLTEDDLRPTDEGRKLSDYVELLEAETVWYNKETKKMEPWLLTVANREVLVVDKPYPYWNTESMYVKGCWIPILNEFYGLGLGEVSEALQEELNDKHNQRIDNVNQILMPVFQYEEGSVDPKYFARWERKPGAKLRMRPGGVNASKWDYAPDVTGTAMAECADIERYLEEVTGAVRAIQPSSGDEVHRTSSGLMLLQAMAHERIKLNLGFLEKMVLEPTFEKYFNYNLQFIGGKYRIFDPEGRETIYTPEMLTGDYEFRSKGSRYALDQQMKIMNLSRVLEDLGRSGLPIGELHINLWMRLYDALGFEDKEEIEQLLRADIAKFQQMVAQAQSAKSGGDNGQNQIRDLSGQGMNIDGIRSGMGKQVPGGFGG